MILPNKPSVGFVRNGIRDSCGELFFYPFQTVEIHCCSLLRDITPWTFILLVTSSPDSPLH